MKGERGGDTRGRSDEQMSAEEGSDRDNGGEGGNKQTRVRIMNLEMMPSLPTNDDDV